jgi:hypothetical protein
MEQPSAKKERVILALGLCAALALAAAQWFSPLSRALLSGRDVRVALLGERSSALLVYHPFSGTVNAFTFQHPRPKGGASGWQRASALALSAGAREDERQDDVFFVALSTAPDLEALWGTLNTWRAEPRRFFAAARLLYRLEAAGDTNISGFDMFSLFAEASQLTAADFILTEAQRKPSEQEAAGPAPELRVEVFNASGKKDLAALAAKYLRARGFDVLTAASNPSRERQTRIFGFSEDTAAALELRSALGLEELEIRVRPSQKSVAGAVVILGEDFDPAILGK